MAMNSELSSSAELSFALAAALVKVILITL